MDNKVLEHHLKQLQGNRPPAELNLPDIAGDELGPFAERVIAIGNKNLIVCNPSTPELQAFCERNKTEALQLAKKIQEGAVLGKDELREVQSRIRAIIAVLVKDLKVPQDDIRTMLAVVVKEAAAEKIEIDLPVTYRPAPAAPAPMTLKKKPPATAPNKGFGLFGGKR